MSTANNDPFGGLPIAHLESLVEAASKWGFRQLTMEGYVLTAADFPELIANLILARELNAPMDAIKSAMQLRGMIIAVKEQRKKASDSMPETGEESVPD